MPAGNTKRKNRIKVLDSLGSDFYNAKSRKKDKKNGYSFLSNNKLTYLIFIATVVSVNDRWSSVRVPQSFIDSIAKVSLFDSS